jgi:predicted O-methyltransferase YrrM
MHETKLMRAERRASEKFERRNIILSPATQECINATQNAALQIHGVDWNYCSGALHPSVAWVIERVIATLPPQKDPVSFLEIGSAKGVSISLIGLMLKRAGLMSELTSIDPYFENGYPQGSRAPWGTVGVITIDKQTRDSAIRLYALLGLRVALIEMDSTRGLVSLLKNDARFDIIYIDGQHEGFQPIIDFGLCRPLLKSNGIVMLDDHMWPDVQPLKTLCDLHGERVAESPKIVAYRL